MFRGSKTRSRMAPEWVEAPRKFFKGSTNGIERTLRVQLGQQEVIPRIFYDGNHLAGIEIEFLNHVRPARCQKALSVASDSRRLKDQHP